MLKNISPDSVLDALYTRFLPWPCEHPDSLYYVPSVLLSDKLCLKAALSRVLGFAIVIFAGFLKLPQIFTILKHQSAEGISLNAYFVETFGYCYNLSFAYRMVYPLTAYGEFALILFQNLIVLGLIFHYKRNTFLSFGIPLLYASTTALMCSTYFPISVLRLLTALNSLIAIGSRLPQVVKNYREGSVGTLSPATCAGLAFGSMVRIFTTLQDVKELSILIGFFVSCSFNFIVLGQVIYYKSLTKGKAVEDAAKKTQ